MKAKLIHDGSEKTYVLIFDKGDEVVSELNAFATEYALTASRFTGIGACERVTLGFYDLEQKDYQKIEVNEQIEVMSLIGNLSLGPNGEPKVHGHIVVGKADGTAHGGHLLEAVVRPTLELFLIESPAELRRQMNSEVGLPLIDLRN